MYDYRNLASGSVTLITNNGGCPDVIFVNEYKNYIVNAVNAEEEKIYLMGDAAANASVSPVKSELVLEQDDTSVAFSFTDMMGFPITVADCKKWDVLSVAESGDGKVMSVIHSNLKVEGAVTQVSDDYIYR